MIRQDFIPDRFRVFSGSMLKLIAVFGTKDGETLDQWIRGDLNSWEISRLNNNLANKGIAYAF